MLGQASPNSITQVMIYNLGYDLKPRLGNKLLYAATSITNTTTLQLYFAHIINYFHFDSEITHCWNVKDKKFL